MGRAQQRDGKPTKKQSGAPQKVLMLQQVQENSGNKRSRRAIDEEGSQAKKMRNLDNESEGLVVHAGTVRSVSVVSSSGT